MKLNSRRDTRWLKTAVVLAAVALPAASCAAPREQDTRQRWNDLVQASPSNRETGGESSFAPSLEGELSLEDCLTYAALNNSGLKSAFYAWKAALEEALQARSLPDPRMTYAYFIREVETRVGPQEHKFGVSQTFPWPGKLSLQEQMAVESALKAEADYQAAKWDLFYRVKNDYFEFAYLARAIDVAGENLKLLRYFEAIARSKFEANLATHGDLIKAQLELGKLEDRLSSLRDLRRPLTAKLNAALNRDTIAPLPWPKSIPNENADFSDGDVRRWLSESNPELKALNHAVERENLAIRRAQKNFYPDVTAGIEWIDTDSALMPGTPGSGTDPVIAILSINAPLWRGKYHAAVRQAEARRDAALHGLEQKRNSLLAQAQVAQFNVRDAARKVSLYRDSLVPKAEQNVSVVSEEYSSGTGNFLDLIDGYRALLELQLSYERSLADRAQSIAELERLAGKTLPTTPAQTSQDDLQ